MNASFFRACQVYKSEDGGAGLRGVRADTVYSEAVESMRAGGLMVHFGLGVASVMLAHL